MTGNQTAVMARCSELNKERRTVMFHQAECAEFRALPVLLDHISWTCGSGDGSKS